jgi:hypothetical protein
VIFLLVYMAGKVQNPTFGDSRVVAVHGRRGLTEDVQSVIAATLVTLGTAASDAGSREADGRRGKAREVRS